MSGTPQPQEWQAKVNIFVLVFVLAGFAFLVFGLGEKSLWGDETFRAYTTDLPLGDIAGFISRVQMHMLPPMYPSSLWVWRSVAGDTEFSLRFPSVIFATIFLPVIYRLGLSTLDKRAGLVVLAVAATSPFLVLSARMVQYYSLLLLLTATSCWLFIQLLQGRTTRVRWAAYVVVCAMALYTQYFAAFVLATQGLIALSQIRKRRKLALKFLAAQTLVILLFAPATAFIVPQSAGRFGGQDAFSMSSLIISAFALVYPLFAWTVGGSIFPWNPAGLLGALLGLSLAAWGVWAVATGQYSDTVTGADTETTTRRASPTIRHAPLRRSQTGRMSTALTCLVFLLVPLCLSVFTLRQVPGATGDPFASNRAVFCVPFLYLLLAAGIVAVHRPALRLLIVVAVGAVAGLSLANYYRGLEFHNPLYVLQTEELANVIHQQAQPGDVFVSDEMTAFGYYIVKTDPDAIHFDATASEDARDYIERRNPESVWLILLCRAVETESSATVLLLPWLRQQGYREELSFGHSPQDATMAHIQELALGRPSCTYKIMVSKYARI